jgi:hypothetical protein
MMKVKRLRLAITASALMLATPLIAADGAATNKSKTMTTTAARRTAAWQPETLSGTIMKVDPDQNLVVVQTSDGVPFDMVVNAKTRIKSGDRSLTLKDLIRDMNKTVSVTFTPERRGDVAKSIQING